jgi:hypothetical protein
MIYVIVKNGPSEEPVVRKQFTFVSRLKKIVKYLMHEEYRVVDSEMNVYDSIHLEFANGCHIYDDYSDLKDVLFYKFAFQTFVYYEDVRRQADIVDEPQGCTDFYTFRALLYERYHWDQMMKHYFKKYVLPHIRGAHCTCQNFLYILIDLFGKGQCFHRIVSQPSSPTIKNCVR